MPRKVCVIDADSLLYEAASVAQDGFDFGDGNIAYATDIDYAKQRFKDKLASILKATKCKVYIAYITGENNFRYKVLPTYKHNRKGLEKPKLLNALTLWALEHFNIVRVDGIEADDACGIKMTELGQNAILAHIDKDLNQIAGTHYDWRKDEIYEISQKDADDFFYIQVLTGDPSDGYTGCPGIGPRKAKDGLLLGYCPYMEEDYAAGKMKYGYTTYPVDTHPWDLVMHFYYVYIAKKYEVKSEEEARSHYDGAWNMAVQQARVAYIHRYSFDAKSDSVPLIGQRID